jgi:hypothetical protein
MDTREPNNERDIVNLTLDVLEVIVVVFVVFYLLMRLFNVAQTARAKFFVIAFLTTLVTMGYFIEYPKIVSMGFIILGILLFSLNLEEPVFDFNRLGFR